MNYSEIEDCGGNGYCVHFKLYQDDQFSKDELLVCSGNEVSLIKIFNYPGK